jgi:hypothetical protein
MRRWRFSVGAVLGIALAGTVAIVACGARSQLEAASGGADGGEGGTERDAGRDARPDADGAEDAPSDVPEDALPECTPDVTYIYVATSQGNLYAYKPQQNAFEHRGIIGCSAGGASPFSMAVDRTGIAHVVYNNGTLWRVSVKDATCEGTPFEPGQHGFITFGMGYEVHAEVPEEVLFVSEINLDDGMGNEPSLGLAWIDTETYELNLVGQFDFNPGPGAELTPTGKGPLHGYFLNFDNTGGTLVHIDTETAAILEATPLPVGNNSSALAIAWWGGRFYIFTTGGLGTLVTRYDPVSQELVEVTQFPETVVGAGVSTCAPE